LLDSYLALCYEILTTTELDDMTQPGNIWMERKQTNLLVFERTVWKLGSRDAIPDGCISKFM